MQLRIQFIVAFAWFAFPISAFAGLEDILPDRYVGGLELFEWTPEVHAKEHGFFVDVPINYDDPSKGTTQIYAYFPHPFVSTRPTAVFFNGGPGFTSHIDEYRLGIGDALLQAQYNVVLFDQRGLGYSRPSTEEQYVSPAFQSVEWIARDADEIRKVLGFGEWVVVGSSFGTVPATMYASIFPQNVKSVVLAATYIGRENDKKFKRNLWAHVQKRPSYELLEKQVIERIELSITTFLDLFDRDLDEYLKLFGTANLDGFFSGWLQTYDLQNAETRTVTGRPPGVRAGDLIYRLDQMVNEMWWKQIHDYSYSEYSIEAPVTYIHGTKDIVTTAAGMIQHYRRVPKGAKQAVLIVDAGHMVLKSSFADQNDKMVSSPYPVPPQILREALDGSFSGPHPTPCDRDLAFVSHRGVVIR